MSKITTITRSFAKSKVCKHSVQFGEKPEAGKPEAVTSLYVKREVLKPGTTVTRTFSKSKDCKHSVQFKEQAEAGQPEAIGSLYINRLPDVENAASVDVILTVVSDTEVTAEIRPVL